MLETRVVIIGGGPAGYTAAIRCAQLGASVMLIEKDSLGGECLHRGCIPTKALWHGVRLIRDAARIQEYGILLDGEGFSFEYLQGYKEKIISSLARGLAQLMAANNIRVLRGKGRLISTDEVEVTLASGIERVKAERIILASGSLSVLPEIPGAAGELLTSDEVLQLKTLPESLIIIGGGVLGVEFATIFAGLGARVSLVEKEPQLLPGEDGEIAAALRRALERAGIGVYTSCHIKRLTAAGGQKVVHLEMPDGETELAAGLVLATTGRKPNLEGLGLGDVGVAVGDSGILVDGRMQTSVPHIYAAGDVTGGRMLAHVAYREGTVAAENAMGHDAIMDDEAIPRCIHSYPEIAAVGMGEEEAKAHGYRVATGNFPLAANGMGAILGEGGFIKVVAGADDGRLLGVHIFSPRASEMIGEAALALKFGASIRDIAATIHAHPSLSEGLAEAAMDVEGRAISIAPRRRV